MNLTKLIKREIYLTVASVLVIVVSFSMITYALFFSVSEGSTNVITYGDITMSYCETNDAACASGVSNMGQVVGYENGGIRLFYAEDDITALSKTPYRFKLTNTGDYTITINIKLNKQVSPVLNTSYSAYREANSANIKVAIGEETTSKGYSPGVNLYSELTDNIIGTYVLAAGESKIFNLWTWLKEEAPNTEQGTYFVADIQVKGEYKPQWATRCNSANNSVGCTIIKDNKVDGAVKEASTLNYAQTALASKTQGLYKTTEKDIDYYFFRGGDYCLKSDGTIDTTNITKATCEAVSGNTWKTLNNNLIFGGYCWQIIRTNEDGSTRVIYNGVPTDGVCNNTGTATRAGTSVFNHSLVILNGKSYSLYGDTSVIGYTHGSPLDKISAPVYEMNISTGTVTSNISLASTIKVATSYTLDPETGLISLSGTVNTTANVAPTTTTYKYTCNNTTGSCLALYEIYEVSGTAAPYTVSKWRKHISYWSSSVNESSLDTLPSTIKTNLENWYNTNLRVNYESYITDSGYCNDRTVYSGNGYGKSAVYSGYRRAKTSLPSLYCANPIQDLYTVSTANGNGHSTCPIGLITLDEVVLAGGGNVDTWVTTAAYLLKTNFYLYTGDSFATMTPGYYENNNYNCMRTCRVYYTGRWNCDCVGNGDLRPVISISSSVKVSGGTGAKDNPYTLTLE